MLKGPPFHGSRSYGGHKLPLGPRFVSEYCWLPDWFQEWFRKRPIGCPNHSSNRTCRGPKAVPERRVLLGLPIGFRNGLELRHVGFPNHFSNRTRRRLGLSGPPPTSQTMLWLSFLCGEKFWIEPSGGFGGPPPKLKVRKGNPAFGSASGPSMLSGPVPWRKLIWTRSGKSGVMFLARRLVFRTGRVGPPFSKKRSGSVPLHKHKA